MKTELLRSTASFSLVEVNQTCFFLLNQTCHRLVAREEKFQCMIISSCLNPLLARVFPFHFDLLGTKSSSAELSIWTFFEAFQAHSSRTHLGIIQDTRYHGISKGLNTGGGIIIDFGVCAKSTNFYEEKLVPTSEAFMPVYSCLWQECYKPLEHQDQCNWCLLQIYIIWNGNRFDKHSWLLNNVKTWFTK